VTLIKEKKGEIIKKFAVHAKDTGSAEVQVALLTERINGLGDHFKTHAKDHSSRRGMLKLVNQRRGLLEYLKKNALERYKVVIEQLNLRK
jgi:small subunit ribosomal protein S15